mmetsp:Transcript_86659/g.260150  ORF Transcript_86659/g.260150 Transcript_86659/m.260150 type:complete len:169 (+) Transcript_86659:997-1503(+)
MGAALGGRGFAAVVADEAHYLKSRKAGRTVAVLSLLRAARRALLLSGTPALSRPAELYTQLHALDPATFGSFKAFANRYCAPRRTAYGVDYSGASQLAELHATVFGGVALRRLKRDTLPQLPPKARVLHLLPTPLDATAATSTSAAASAFAAATTATAASTSAAAAAS